MLWEENKIDDYVDDYSDELNNTRDEKRETQSHNGLFEALKELKKPEVLCIGIIESIFQGVLTIFFHHVLATMIALRRCPRGFSCAIWAPVGLVVSKFWLVQATGVGA